MTGVLVLVAWMASGVAIAALAAPDERERFSWAPMAAILGPLWFGIALDRAEVARNGAWRHADIDLTKDRDLERQSIRR